jgi:agmatinase
MRIHEFAGEYLRVGENATALTLSNDGAAGTPFGRERREDAIASSKISNRTMSIRQAAALPHTGIATFCKAPHVFEPSKEEVDVAILGVPFDNMASMRPGCRQAPRALRDASTRFGWLGEPAGSSGFFDIGANTRHLSGIRLADAGDVDVHLDAEITRERTTARARSIVESGVMLAAIGGDHSVTFPLICGFEKYGPLTIVLFDAHLDYRDKSMDMRFSNNSPFRRARELPFVKRIVTIGVRGIKSTDREYRESLDHGNLIFPMERIHEDGVASIVQEIGALGKYYVSLDIDGLDPSIAPGTESPEADGLSFRQAKQLLRGIARQGQLAGVDIAEVNPYLDHAELTQHIAVQLLLEAIASGFPTVAASFPR